MKNSIKSAVKAVAAAVTGKRGSAEIEVELHAAIKDRDAKASRLTNLTGDKETAFRRLDRERVEELDAEIKALEKDLNYANQAVANLEAEEREALAREIVERWNQKRDEVLARKDRTRKIFLENVPELSRGIVLAVREKAETDIAIEELNASRPDGVEPIATIEEELTRRSLPRVVLSEERVELWTHPTGQILPDEAQKQVQDNGDGTGTLPASPDRSERKLYRRRFVRRKFLPAVSAGLIADYETELHLPGVGDQPPFFEPLHSGDSRSVLEALARLEAYAKAAPGRTPQVEIVPVEDELPDAAE
ncbi:hypothetical protein [Microvirga sp. CF3016]|uniref:hypothetical protein n=1 Tax=Microvirga sp. CF3016 TaxID=3110181 RepID=UPI002E776479|nr:hypothetical protein [Microvirga sp. CF3016]MEE1611112.1 hypothetical protein [Microvirga sp. CF3016]